jgi:four helix bundle protein
MSAIRRFEDIEAWKRARELSRRVYAITNQGSFRRDFALRNQIRDASVSVMSNIAEGFEPDGNKEFKQFLYIAKAAPARFVRNFTLHSTRSTSIKPRLTKLRQPLLIPSVRLADSFAISNNAI